MCWPVADDPPVGNGTPIASALPRERRKDAISSSPAWLDASLTCNWSPVHWWPVIGAKGAVRQVHVTPLECRNSRHSAPGGHRGLTAVLTWPPCFQVRPMINGTLRTCMRACPPVSARRSNHAPSLLAFRPGMVSPHTTDLPAEKSRVWAILGRHVNVHEIFQNISRTNTPTERQESGPRALVSQSVQGHGHLSVNGEVD